MQASLNLLKYMRGIQELMRRNIQIKKILQIKKALLIKIVNNNFQCFKANSLFHKCFLSNLDLSKSKSLALNRFINKFLKLS